MSSFFDSLKTAAGEVASSASSAQEKILQEYLPKIAIVLREKAGPAIIDILSDIERLAELARTAYQALPMPVRLVVKEQSFIDWVLSHQDKVVEAVKNQLVIEGGSTLVPDDLPPSPEVSLSNAAEISEPDAIDSAITSTPVT
jgi:hypothetical protein